MHKHHKGVSLTYRSYRLSDYLFLRLGLAHISSRLFPGDLL